MEPHEMTADQLLEECLKRHSEAKTNLELRRKIAIETIADKLKNLLVEKILNAASTGSSTVTVGIDGSEACGFLNNKFASEVAAKIKTMVGDFDVDYHRSVSQDGPEFSIFLSFRVK